MTYAAQEVSAEGGRPVELFDLRIGTDAFLWTTSPDEVTYNSLTYVPTEVKREPLMFSPDERAEALKITVPASLPIVRRYINSVPSEKATMTIRRVHRSDGSNQVTQLFKGVAKAVAFTLDGLQAEIAVLPISAELEDSIPRFVYSSRCNHVLYDQGCTVAQSLFRHSNTVTAVSGDTLTVIGLSAKGDGWATGGYVARGAGDFRLVIEHVGNNVRLLLPFPDNVTGETVEVFAGCAHDIDTCGSKFGNVINFGGFAWVPLNNPFANGLDSA